jgi:hypothetical protein
LSIYCDGESFKQLIYFYKCRYLIIMPSILTESRDSSFSANDGGVLRALADDESQEMVLFDEDTECTMQ